MKIYSFDACMISLFSFHHRQNEERCNVNQCTRVLFLSCFVIYIYIYI